MLVWQLVFQIVPDVTCSGGQHRVQVAAVLEVAPPNLQAGRPSPTPPASICSMQLSVSFVFCAPVPDRSSVSGTGRQRSVRWRVVL
jgi:hypothetical protein